MTSYLGRYPELYDTIYADKPYADESSFVDRCLRSNGCRPGSRILELACGTGTHAILLSNLGYHVTAIDSSPGMLARAKDKAGSGSGTLDFRQQSMEALDVPGEPFDAAVCLFDSIGYVLTDEAVTEVLRRVRRHLRSGGPFIFEFWHAPAMLRSYSPVRVRRWPIPGGEVLRISETALETATRTAKVTYSVYEHFADGTYREHRETHRNRCFAVDEMGRLLESAGLEPVKWFAGFSESIPITDETWHVVCVAAGKASPGE